MDEIEKALATRANLEMALHLVSVEAKRFPKAKELLRIKVELRVLADKAEARYVDELVNLRESHANAGA